MKEITHTVTEDNLVDTLSQQVEGACLYFRRAIVYLPASLRKEQLLFYMDQLIDGDFVSSPTEAWQILLTVESLLSHEAITQDMRQHFAYLSDTFHVFMQHIQKGRAASLAQTLLDETG